MSSIDLSGNESIKYKIIKKLGAGSYGVVYKAYNKILQEDCALKIIPTPYPEKLASCYKEAEIPNKCRHPNIVAIKTADPIVISNGEKNIRALAIEMELLNGGSIEDLIRQRFVPITESVTYAVSILSGLEYAHINDVIHCDIKPGNVLLDKNGSPKISDFGLSFIVSQPVEDENINFYISHAAPELKVQNIRPNILTDIYAFGVTFFRMVNNISDWKSFRSNSSYKSAIENGEFGRRHLYQPYVPRKIIRIISKACNAEPQKRYQTASEMRNALNKLNLCHNWHPVVCDESQWQAEDSSSIYSVELQQIGSGHFAFQYKKNGRRVNSFCRDFDSLDKSVSYLYEFIAENSVS